MGQEASSQSSSAQDALSPRPGRLTSKERGLLEQIFHEIANRPPYNCGLIDRRKFEQVLDLHGHLGERIFELYDENKDGLIDLEDFLEGYYRFIKSEGADKVRMIFSLCDLDGDRTLTQPELRIVLLSLVQHPMQILLTAEDPEAGDSDSIVGTQGTGGSTRSTTADSHSRQRTLDDLLPTPQRTLSLEAQAESQSGPSGAGMKRRRSLRGEELVPPVETMLGIEEKKEQKEKPQAGRGQEDRKEPPKLGRGLASLAKLADEGMRVIQEDEETTPSGAGTAALLRESATSHAQTPRSVMKKQTSLIQFTSTLIDDAQSVIDETVKRIFLECDVNKDGRLSLEEFEAWMARNAVLIETFDDLLINLLWMLPVGSDETSSPGSHPEEKLSTEEVTANGSTSNLQFTERIVAKVCESCEVAYVRRRTHRVSDKSFSIVVVAGADDGFTSTDDLKGAGTGKPEDNPDDPFGQLRFCQRCGHQVKRRQERLNVGLRKLSSHDPHGAGRSPLAAGGGKPGVGARSSRSRQPRSCWVQVSATGRFGQRTFKKRFVRAFGKFVHVYKRETDSVPQDAIFIQGYSVQRRGRKELALVPPRESTRQITEVRFASEEECAELFDALVAERESGNIRNFYGFSRVLGKGSFAEVYQGWDLESGKEVAIKKMSKAAMGAKEQEYVRVELSIMKLVKHPRVMHLIRYFENSTSIYLVMPLYKGVDLLKYLKVNYNRTKRGLDEADAKYVVYHLLHALRYLHNLGIVHRDLKPENLLLKSAENPRDIVIADFGLSKYLTPSRTIQTFVGTLPYAAPEIIRMEPYSDECDIWSVGVIMFFVLAIKYPFYHKNQMQMRNMIMREPPPLAEGSFWRQRATAPCRHLCRRLLTKSVKERITIEEAMRHPWLQDVVRRKKEESAAKRSPHARVGVGARATRDDTDVKARGQSGQYHRKPTQ